MVRAQRALADVLADGEWTPLVDTTAAALAAGVYASRFRTPTMTLWTIINRGVADFTGHVIAGDAGGGGAVIDVTAGTALDGVGSEVTVPGRGVSGVLHVVGDVPPLVDDLLRAARDDRHSGDDTFPARLAVRVVPLRSTARPPADDAIALSPGAHTMSVHYRLRETGMYDGAPFVEEWKPLPPRLHADVSEQHTVEIGDVAVANIEVAGDDGDGAHRTVARRGARLRRRGRRPPTDRVRVAARRRRAGVPPRRAARVELDRERAQRRHHPIRHPQGWLRATCAEGSEWYFDGGPRPPEFSAKLLLAGPAIAALTVDRIPPGLGPVTL